MSKTYYARSGEFANALMVQAFATMAERDAWVEAEPMSGVGSHYEHDRRAITRREADSLCASNRQARRDHASGHPDDNFGTAILPVVTPADRPTAQEPEIWDQYGM